MDLRLQLQNLALTYGLGLLKAVLTFIIGRWLISHLTTLLERILKRSSLDPMVVGFMHTLAHYSLLAFLIVVILGQLGIETASLAALLAAMGLAIGLALQGALANFAAGVLVLVLRPFKVGEQVVLADSLGYVESIHIFSTQLRTNDNKRIFIPNGMVMSNKIINYTARGALRVELVVGISYGDNLQRAKEALETMLQAHPLVLKEPAPVVGVLELAESSVKLAVWPFCKPQDYWPAYFSLTEHIKLSLDAAGITIPFPQRDIHLIDKAGVSERASGQA